MSDFDLDNMLATAIEDYKVTTMPQIKAAGTRAAYATATHRKHVRTGVLGVVVLAVLAVPAALYATSGGDHSVRPHGLANAVPAVTSSSAATSIAPSASPASSASPSAPTSPSASGLATEPITQAALANATLDMPSWSGGLCPVGKQKLHNGVLPGTTAKDGTPLGYHTLWKVYPAAFDTDGTADAVAIFQCGPGDPPDEAAIALRRATDGTIEAFAPVQTAAYTILQLTSNSDGTVSLLVSNLGGSDGTAAAMQTPQWRTYALSGTRFQQVAGSAAFETSTSGVTASESDLVFAPAAGGVRKGTLTVTLHNVGSKTVGNASVVFYTDQADNITPGCAPAAAVADAMDTFDHSLSQCQAGSMAPGASKTLTFTISAPADDFSGSGVMPTTVQGWLAIQVLVGDQALATQPSGGTVVLR